MAPGNYHPYQSPDAKLSNAYRPKTIKAMLPLCREIFLTDPFVNAAVMKMAEYPLTDIIVDEDDTEARETWSDFLNDQLQVPIFEKLMAIDYFGQGNSFIIPHLKIRKYLVCKQCGKAHDIEGKDIKRKWRFANFQYRLKCPKCGHHGDARVHDQYIRSARSIRLIRVDPSQVTIYHGYGFTDPIYAVEIPKKLQRDIKLGRKHVIKSIPHEFVEALRQKKQLIMNSDQIYHMKRPNTSHPDYAWGLPLQYPVLDDIHYRKMLRKAQESIAAQHILPFNVMFPSSTSANSDLTQFVDLGSWRTKALSEIEAWRKDPNYIAVMPTPMGFQSIGGTGRALMLHQELQLIGEEIIQGMGVPLEFIKGGLQWSGTDISLKALANQFTSLVSGFDKFLNSFLIPFICSSLGWPRVKVRHKRFRMANDLQRNMMLFQMAQAGKVSDTTMLEDAELDPVLEAKNLKKEHARQIGTMREAQKAHARTQGEVSVIQAHYQAKAQKLMMEGQMESQMAAQQQQHIDEPAAAESTNPPPSGSSEAWSRLWSRASTIQNASSMESRSSPVKP